MGIILNEKFKIFNQLHKIIKKKQNFLKKLKFFEIFNFFFETNNNKTLLKQLQTYEKNKNKNQILKFYMFLFYTFF